MTTLAISTVPIEEATRFNAWFLLPIIALICFCLWPKSYDARALSCRKIPCGLELRWQSTKAYPSQIVCSQDGRVLFEQKETVSTTKHTLEVVPLVPGKEYELTVLYPDGTKGEPFKARAGKPKVSLAGIKTIGLLHQLSFTDLPASVHALRIIRDQGVTELPYGQLISLDEQVVSISLLGKTLCDMNYVL